MRLQYIRCEEEETKLQKSRQTRANQYATRPSYVGYAATPPSADRTPGPVHRNSRKHSRANVRNEDIMIAQSLTLAIPFRALVMDPWYNVAAQEDDREFPMRGYFMRVS